MNKPMIRTVAEDLRAIADIIETQGWWNGMTPNASVENQCVVTAHNTLMGCNMVDVHTYMTTLEFMKAQSGVDYIPNWNDSQASGEVVCKQLRMWADEWEDEHH
jgi:hypothetical protein